MTIPEQIKSLQNLVDLAIKLQKDFPEDTSLELTISMYLYKIEQLKTMQKSGEINQALAKAHNNLDELLAKQAQEFQAAQEQIKVATNEAALYQYGLQVGDIIALKTKQDTTMKILSFHAIPSIIDGVQLYNIFARTVIFHKGKIDALKSIFGECSPENYYPKIDYLCQLLTKITHE